MYGYGGPMKYQVEGTVLGGGSPYSANILPAGLYPSESVVYSAGADEILEQKNQDVITATQHLSDAEDFNYEQELLAYQDEVGSRTGDAISGTIGAFQKLNKINPMKPVLPTGYGPTEVTTYGLELAPSETFGSGIYNTPSAPSAPVDLVDDYMTVTPATSAETAASIGDTANIYGQDLSTKLQPRKITGIDTSQNVISTSTTTTVPGRTMVGQLLKPDKFNPGVTAAAGTVAAIGGDLIRSAADDNDPTTVNVGETAGTLIGSAGRGAGVASLVGSLAPALAVPGLGWAAAGIGALIGGISAIRRRNKARREKRKQDRALARARARRDEAINASQIAAINTKKYFGQDTGRAITDLGRRQGYLKLGGMPYNYA